MTDQQTDVQTALFANDAFYTAFATKDPDAMAVVWSESAAVTCLHPGWPPLGGRDAVLKSWTAILTAENAPDVECRAPEAFVTGEVARVICFEMISDVSLIATNMFVRESGGWKMVHHQSGPGTQAPDAEQAVFNA